MEINFVDGCCNLRISVVCPENIYNFIKNKYISFILNVFNQTLVSSSNLRLIQWIGYAVQARERINWRGEWSEFLVGVVGNLVYLRSQYGGNISIFD